MLNVINRTEAKNTISRNMSKSDRWRHCHIGLKPYTERRTSKERVHWREEEREGGRKEEREGKTELTSGPSGHIALPSTPLAEGKGCCHPLAHCSLGL